ncbi:MAG TPA: FAD-dependent oxidoreductase, partial [Candidatus Limnocylindrales bacterium]|nr:FAD-dependent oxidoreductase [Candidatus Limnocylindrales bacterium]
MTRPGAGSSSSAIVLGGGMAGIAAAERLAQAGLSVTLLEAGPTVGGLARAIRVEGEPIEAYYHHIFPQDRETLELIERFGLAERLEWRPGRMAVLHEGVVYPFDSVADLLRFRPLRLDERLRFGIATAVQLVRRDAARLDRLPVGRAARREFGAAAYDTLWRPLLEAKFGPYADDVTLAWLVARIRQRAAARGVRGDRLGYLRGSLGLLAERFAEHVRSLGVDVRTGTRVTRLERAGDAWLVRVADAAGESELRAGLVVACLSGNLLRRLVELPEAYRARIDAIPYRGVVCLLAELDRSLSPYYWVNVTDRLGLGCVGIIEHTNFIPPERYGGRHLLYLAHYVDRESETWTASPEALVEAAEEALRVLNPAFDRSWIVRLHVSRDPYAQPVPLAGGPMPGLPVETGLPGLAHASLAHVYPDDRGVSLAIRLGRRAADAARATVSGSTPEGG